MTKAKFLHFADMHLGYRQYSNDIRMKDFSDVFRWIVEKALREEVDFVIFAGDLFEKRSIAPSTLDDAVVGLTMLKEGGIPFIAVEGNHELSYYSDRISWCEYLAERGLVTLLQPTILQEPSGMYLSRVTGSNGAYTEPVEGIRVHGLRYMGSSQPIALKMWGEALRELKRDGIDYQIGVSHFGMHGILSDEMGGLSRDDVAPIKPHFDYLALGHIHKPYEVDSWIYNPGSPETNSFTEAEWTNRGYIMVEVDTDKNPKHKVIQEQNPRRKFMRLIFNVTKYDEPEDIMQQCFEFIDSHKGQRWTEGGSVIELIVQGYTSFPRYALSSKLLEERVTRSLFPIHCQVVNNTIPVMDTAGPLADSERKLTREEMQNRVFVDLIGQDIRYKDHAEQLAKLTADIMSMALDDASPESILERLETGYDQIKGD